MIKIKNKIFECWIFLKRCVLENKLRLGIILFMILGLISFFFPFMSLKADVSITGFMDNTLEIITDKNDIMSFSLGDFVLQEPIDEIEIFDIALGDIKIFETPILEILRNPIPDKGIVSKADAILSNPALDFLVDPEIQKVVTDNLAIGEDINYVLTGTWDVIQNAKEIVGAVNQISIQAQESMKEVNEIMATVDQYKTTANSVIFSLFFIGSAITLLLFYKPAPMGISIGIIGALVFVFLGIGIGVGFVNAEVNNQLLGITTQMNAEILQGMRDLLTATLGDLGNYVANFMGKQANYVSMTIYLKLGIGYWITTLSFVSGLILSIILRHKNKKVTVSNNLE